LHQIAPSKHLGSDYKEPYTKSLTRFIGSKNYAVSSVRAGVLLRAFNIQHHATLIHFDSFAPGSTFENHVVKFSSARSVPSAINDALADATEQPLVIWNTLAIFEHLTERFLAHPI
jgi:glutathione S-transferase